MLFQCYVQRLFSADEHIVLFGENTPRNPDFDYDRFELADIWRIPNARANFILKTDLPELAEAPHLPQRFHYSQRQNEENHEDVHGTDISKTKEKLISHLNLNLVVLHDSSLSLPTAHFFHHLYD